MCLPAVTAERVPCKDCQGVVTQLSITGVSIAVMSRQQVPGSSSSAGAAAAGGSPAAGSADLAAVLRAEGWQQAHLVLRQWQCSVTVMQRSRQQAAAAAAAGTAGGTAEQQEGAADQQQQQPGQPPPALKLTFGSSGQPQVRVLHVQLHGCCCHVHHAQLIGC